MSCKIILYIIIPIFINNEITKINLITPVGFPYINIKIGENDSYYNMVFDTSLHRSLLVSPKCKICTKPGYNVNNSIKISENQTQLKDHYLFSGDEYQDKAQISSLDKFKINFLSFTNVTFASEVGTNGFFGFSFTNYKLNTSKKLFALLYKNSYVSLHIGDFDKEIMTNYSLLKNYTISYNENKTQWFLLSDNLKINDKNVKTKEKQKLILDSSTTNLYIPKKFFFDNIDIIFNEDNNCQILASGIFSCVCDENYKTKFGNFQFNISGEILFINVTDYISFDSSIRGNNCYVYIIINYVNEYWVAGNNVLNNYYCIFDIDNNTLRLYDIQVLYENNSKFIIVFFVVFFISILSFFGGYLLYKKYYIDNEDERVETQ